MAMKIVKDRGYWRIDDDLCRLLNLCRGGPGEAPFQSGMDCISVKPGEFCATDGRRLILVKVVHPLEPGLYLLTADCLLLPMTDDGIHFPNYARIIMGPTGTKTIDIKTPSDELTLSTMVYEINQQKTAINLAMFLPVMEVLIKIGAFRIALRFEEGTARNRPIQVEMDLPAFNEQATSAIYVQMPIRN